MDNTIADRKKIAVLVSYREVVRDMQRQTAEAVDAASVENRKAFKPTEIVVGQVAEIMDDYLAGHDAGDPGWSPSWALDEVIGRLQEMWPNPVPVRGECNLVEWVMHYGPSRDYVRESIDILQRWGY